MVERLFLAVPRGCLQFVIVVFSDHTHLLFLLYSIFSIGFSAYSLYMWQPHFRELLPFETLELQYEPQYEISNNEVCATSKDSGSEHFLVA